MTGGLPPQCPLETCKQETTLPPEHQATTDVPSAKTPASKVGDANGVWSGL